MATTQIKGLKLMTQASPSRGQRRDEWNRPNAKSLKRLNARIADFEKIKDPAHEMHKPGSMKVR